MRMSEHSDAELLPTKGYRLADCKWDYGLVLILNRGDSVATLRVETAAQLGQGGEFRALRPDLPDCADAAASLLGEYIEQSFARGDGTLIMEFSNGSQLLVPPDDNYEAWQLSISDGQLMVCLPGGGMACWGPNR